jgi:hypothetical protein
MRRVQSMITKSGIKPEEAIKKAMQDLEITNAECEEIIHLAHDGWKIDAHERLLLQELQSTISHKTIGRVP